MKIKALCVYCGSRVGADPDYEDQARRLGSLMAERAIGLVYGAGSIGLMGVVARSVMAGGAPVTGIIPHHLDKVEIVQDDLTEAHVVDNMHVRKRMMFDRSDAFIALPGGLGTIDEFIEVTTWAQLGLHSKPIVLVNTQGYWDPLLALIHHVIDQGFASASSAHLYHVVDSVDGVLPLLDGLPEPKMPTHPDLI